MARCNECNRFVSYDTEVDPEENDEPTLTDGEFHVEYTRTLTCADCSTELKTASIEITQTIEVTPKECSETEDKEHEWEFDLNATPNERSEGTGRGTRTFYGVDVSGTAKCTHCGLSVDISASGDEQASAFDDA